MLKKIKARAQKTGMMPGAVVYVGPQRTEAVSIDVIDFDQDNLTRHSITTAEEAFEYRDRKTITWLNLDGIHDVGIIEQLGQHYGLPPLALEDIVNAGHRPKLEEGDGYLLVIMQMLVANDNGEGSFQSEQVSIVIGSGYVISFQQTPDDILDAVRTRIEKTLPRVRFLHADYLGYALIDTIVDHYFVVLERIGERVEALENDLIDQPEPEHLQEIYRLKRELAEIRRAVWPLREVIGGIDRSESPLLSDITRPYLRDLYEHTIQVIDMVETNRDMVSGLLDIYLSSVSNRMNQVMKVLTIIATIFIPLGFLAGVYGMNFDTSASPFNLPELSFEYGYPLFWLVVVVIAVSLLWFFRRRGWL